MLDYALSFYQNYTIIFYILLIVTVIFEWPITILFLSILSQKFGFSFWFIFFIWFIWEFFWDLLHYVLGRIFHKNISNSKKYEFFEKVKVKLAYHSLFDKIIVIKYIPPITSIWLIYLGLTKVDFYKFVKNVIVFATINSLIITSIWFNFWLLLKDRYDFEYIIIWVMLSLLMLYLTFKLISTYISKKYLNGNKNT